VPQGVRLYAIGDVHGCADLLDQILARIDADLVANPVSQPVEILLGDYIDRGPASRGVLDRLIARSKARTMVFLKGNHETYVERFLADPSVLGEWRQFGGLETLMSYGLLPYVNITLTEPDGVAAAFDDILPDSHRRFLSALRTSFTCGDFFFVHAGVRPGIALEKQAEEDLLWIRDDFLLCEDDLGKVVVHGHTPVRGPEIRSNRINIDTGAYATGRLTCLKLEDDKMYFFHAAR
jgi:serine/threonine protein phosphatase 1